jgi:hypothetical protein
MHIPGHLAVAFAQHGAIPKSRRQRRLLVVLLVASLFPDMLDKTIGYVLKMMPNGRHFAHNIFSLFGVSLLVGLIGGKAAGYTWFGGHLGHLLADSKGFVPWLFPLKKYHFYKGRLTFKPLEFIRETIFLILTLAVYYFFRR